MPVSALVCLWSVAWALSLFALVFKTEQKTNDDDDFSPGRRA